MTNEAREERALYDAAARRCLTANAAERYCAGDMAATDEAGHELIAIEAARIAAEAEGGAV
jgi:hypothetical protein